MVPRLAALACLAFIGWLFWSDLSKRERRISWIPLCWMFIAGSRFVSSWLNLSGPLDSVDAYAEGSPVDRAVFFALIIAGVFVLGRRQVDWPRVVARNWLVGLYFLYCLTSVLWTDEPIILLKRFVKDLGNPIVALILLTEEKPFEAIGVTLRRLAFLLLPLSLLFVRYFPELGRTYHVDGSPMYTGVGHQKNDLGLMCLTAGIYFGWKLLQARNGDEAAERFDRYDFLLVLTLAWLLRMSNSQTSLSCLIVALGILLASRLPLVRRRQTRLVPVLAVVGVAYFALDSVFGVRESILAMLGRDASLTNRTELWQVVTEQQVHSVVGAGFMSFWAGDRMEAIWRALGAGINQAHNGYLEQYLNLGYIGVSFICLIMLATLFRIRKQLGDPGTSAGALLKLCLVVSAALYNYTEASFYGINNMWVLLLVAAIDVPLDAVVSAPAVHRPVRAVPRPSPSLVRAPSLRTGRSPSSTTRLHTAEPHR